MKTLLLLVGLLLTCENGRVLGDKAVSDAELQGKWSRGSPRPHFLTVRAPSGKDRFLLCIRSAWLGPASPRASSLQAAWPRFFVVR